MSPYEDFASRLRQMLDRAPFVPGLGRTSALAHRYAVSRETARKWLTGLALPELPRIIELARDFDASFEWLATGRGHVNLSVKEPSATYRRLTESESRMLDAFHNLSEDKRQLLVEFLS